MTNLSIRDTQYCFCLAEYYLNECKPANPRFAIQSLISALSDNNITLPEKVIVNLRLAQLYYKYTENFNHVQSHLELAISFARNTLTFFNNQLKNSVNNIKIYDTKDIIKVCPIEAYAEAVHLQAIITLPINYIKDIKFYEKLSDEIKKTLQMCLNDLAECGSWAGEKLKEWQVKLALKMATILYREADYDSATEFLAYGIAVAKPHKDLEYYFALLSLAKSMIELNQFNKKLQNDTDNNEDLSNITQQNTKIKQESNIKILNEIENSLKSISNSSKPSINQGRIL